MSRDSLGQFEGDLTSHPAFNKSLAHFRRVKGADLIQRTEPLHQWLEHRRDLSVWPYQRSLERHPGPTTATRTDTGAQVNGINFANQDYLSMALHPSVAEAAVRAIHDFGVHSAGSGALVGNTSLSLALEQAIGEMLQMDHVLLFPTGWGACYGTITGLVRASDYILMDNLAHASMQSGALAATENVIRYPHLDDHAVEEHLREIRSRDISNAILVVTEGLFSMESDVPDIARLQTICHEWGATLLVDVAHDLGAMGPGGTGSIGSQKMLGAVDLVVGTFSKTFASNGGFLAMNSRSARDCVSCYGGSYMFSNALSPVQSSVVLDATRIIRSQEGTTLRARLMERVCELRSDFQERGISCMGTPSPIVSILIGSEKSARVASVILPKKGVLANLCEFPAVALGSARFRLQVMSGHTSEHIQTAARAVTEAIIEGQTITASWTRCPERYESCPIIPCGGCQEHEPGSVPDQIIAPLYQSTAYYNGVFRRAG